ncbi:MAG: hypothetical protein LBO80_05020 [Treponema sp.]|nr:hypothetical protein [Treponema sp.]
MGAKLLLFLMLFTAGALPAQAKNEFFAGPLAEASFYSRKTAAYGGGFILGGGGGPTALGLMVACLVDGENITTLEATTFLRVYVLPGKEREGLFAQLNAGLALFNLEGVSVPAESGTLSVGLMAGWRFLLGRHWYVDSIIRTGWPYIAGAGVSAGFRF